MSTEQGHEKAPAQAPVRFTRRMREAIESLRDAIGTPEETASKRRAQLALSGDYRNFHAAARNRLRRNRRAAKLARSARRVSRRDQPTSGGGGARPRPETRKKLTRFELA